MSILTLIGHEASQLRRMLVLGRGTRATCLATHTAREGKDGQHAQQRRLARVTRGMFSSGMCSAVRALLDVTAAPGQQAVNARGTLRWLAHSNRGGQTRQFNQRSRVIRLSSLALTFVTIAPCSSNRLANASPSSRSSPRQLSSRVNSLACPVPASNRSSHPSLDSYPRLQSIRSSKPRASASSTLPSRMFTSSSSPTRNPTFSSTSTPSRSSPVSLPNSPVEVEVERLGNST